MPRASPAAPPREAMNDLTPHTIMATTSAPPRPTAAWRQLEPSQCTARSTKVMNSSFLICLRVSRRTTADPPIANRRDYLPAAGAAAAATGYFSLNSLTMVFVRSPEGARYAMSLGLSRNTAR